MQAPPTSPAATGAAPTAPNDGDISPGDRPLVLGTARKWWLAAVSALACFCAELSFSGAIFGTPTIIQEIETDRYRYNWALGPFLVALVTAIVAAPRIQRSLGSRIPFVIGSSLLCAGSLLASVSTRLDVLIVARLLMAGKGVMLAVSLAQLWIVFPRRRGLTMALYSAATFGSIPITLSLGAFLAFNPSWRAVYALAGAGSGAAALLGWFVLLPDRPSDPPRGGWDVPGIALFATWLSCATFLILMGQYFGWWSDPLVSTVFVAMIVALALFVWRELTTERPAVDFRLRPARTLGLVLTALGLFSIVIIGILETLPGYFILRGDQGPQVGWVLLPCGIVFVAFVLVAGTIVGRAANLRTMRLGLAVLAAGTVLLTRIDLYTSRGWICAVLCVWAAGGGLALPTGLWLTFEGQTIDAVQRLATIKTALRFLALIFGSLAVGLISQRAGDAAFDDLRQSITWTRSAPFQVQADLERHVRSRGSQHEAASAQASAILADWVAVNAQIDGYRSSLRYLALVAACGFAASLGVASRHEADSPASTNVLAGDAPVRLWKR